MAIIGIPQRRSSYFLTLGVVWPPFLSIEDEHCCLGLASVSLALLDSFQRIPYGTLAWKQSYGRRNIIEKSNAMLKDKGGLDAGWCRSFGLAAHTIGTLALAIAHNLKQTLRVERTQTQKPGRPARPKSIQPTRRKLPTDTLSPRAPP